MWSLTSVVPLLLGSTSPPKEMLARTRSAVNALTGAPISKSYTPTIKFSYVEPNKESGSSLRNMTCSNKDQDNPFQDVAASHNFEKPLALYLPGLDGLGISGFAQFDDMANAFEFWHMTVSSKDRSSFTNLKTAVMNFIEEAAVEMNRDLILIGESFGGLLAPGVVIWAATENKRKGRSNPIKGLVMVNPATSFDSSELWQNLGPVLPTLKHLTTDESSSLPTAYSVIGGAALAATVPDGTQYRQIASMITGTQVQNMEELAETFGTMKEGFDFLHDFLPPDAVEHRISQWLPVGCAVVNPRLSEIDVPTLIVGGSEDNMLPTKQEMGRLVKAIPNSTKNEIKGSGHLVLDSRVNLTQLIFESELINHHPEKDDSFDPITDWKLPSEDKVKELIEENVANPRSIFSPVFVSTDDNGKRKMGLSQLPSAENGPLLIVANHQFGGIDLSMIIAQLIEDRGIAARGLAHPIIFQRNEFSTDQTTNAGMDDQGLFEKMGAVQVTPRNYYRLMQTGQTALLFPGGVREVFHGKEESYQLFWPDKVDFVRIAAKFNATILPLSAIGAADSVNILVDAPDMVKLPFGLGDRIASLAANMPSARQFDASSNELFVAPFALPKIPARFYFMFGKPMSTEHLDSADKAGCEKLYKDVKQEMKRGFSDLLTARERDPFKDTLRRFAFERATGKKAPTFSMEHLH